MNDTISLLFEETEHLDAVLEKSELVSGGDPISIQRGQEIDPLPHT